MALSSFFAAQPHVDKIVTADEYAREAQDLLPEMLNESVTLDGLQALTMLVRPSFSFNHSPVHRDLNNCTKLTF